MMRGSSFSTQKKYQSGNYSINLPQSNVQLLNSAFDSLICCLCQGQKLANLQCVVCTPLLHRAVRVWWPIPICKRRRHMRHNSGRIYRRRAPEDTLPRRRRRQRGAHPRRRSLQAGLEGRQAHGQAEGRGWQDPGELPDQLPSC